MMGRFWMRLTYHQLRTLHTRIHPKPPVFWFRTIATSAVYRSYKLSENVRGCYQVLQVPDDSDLDVVRESYLQLAKKFHPDGQSKLADAQRFSQIEEAYRTIVKFHQKRSDDASSEEKSEAAVFDIRHTAPQHRHYLNYEGVGFGTPSKRERQYQNYRVMRASENVMDYRTTKISAVYENSMVLKDHAYARKKKLSSAIDRLVEDLILESMSKGEFDNLPGSGKPLTYSGYNPMVDATTHNLNKVLIDNGYKPEWVLLQKEISEQMLDAKSKLFTARVAAGSEPISQSRKYNWDKNVAKFRENVDVINQKIHKMNMIVPSMQQQIIPYNAERSIQKLLASYHEKLKLGEIETYRAIPQEIVYHYKPLDPKDRVSLKDIMKEIRALFSKS